ncbi:MAG: outer membrane beta-barrel protein [Bdellovibrionota bacterium]
MQTKLKNVLFFAFGIFSISALRAESLGPYERSLASDADYSHAIQPALGFNRGQIVFNIDYEYRLSEHIGAGGNFYFTPEHESTGYSKVVGVAAHAKLHASLGEVDFYARPGLGFARVDYKVAGSSKDSVILAPIFGIGAIYRVADNVGVGVEYLNTFNWTNDDVFESKHDFLIATQIRF